MREPPDETFEGTCYEARLVVTRVFWSTPKICYFTGRDEFGRSLRIVGPGLEAATGDAWLLRGLWQDHVKYGPQLHVEVDRCTRMLPPHPLIRLWLTQFDGVGPQRASVIAAAFSHLEGGLERAFGGSIPIEELAAEIAPDRPFMAARIATEIVARWREVRGEYETLKWLEGVGVSEARLACKLVRLIGPGAKELLEQDPYILSAMIPWNQVDVIGRQVLAAKGIPLDLACCRWVGAVESVLREQVAEGHTAIPKALLGVQALKRLEPLMRPSRGTAVKEYRMRFLEAAALQHSVVIDGDSLWRIPGCAMMEDEIENRLRTTSNIDRSTTRRLVAKEHVGHASSAATSRTVTSKSRATPAYDFQGGLLYVPPRATLKATLNANLKGWLWLAEEQREALLDVFERPVATLVGGAGVGKTATCKAICDSWEMLGGKLELCALSGKAALRLSEATGRTTRTIYRLLRDLEQTVKADPNEADQGTKRGFTDRMPTLDQTTLLVVDEASMVDLASLHQLTEKLEIGTRVLLIGDPFQLPPVSFGMPFHSLAEDPALRVELKTVWRQTEASGIPKIALAIREKRKAKFGPYSPMGEGVGWQEVGDSASLIEAIDKVVEEAGGFSTIDHKLVIVTATNEKGSASALRINQRYHTMKQTRGNLPEIKGQLGQWFSPGEPIVHLSNDYERELYNGSLGHVLSVDTARQTILAKFAGRELTFTRTQMLDVSLAYALTCHRMQGSQAERVLIPITQAAPINPSWLYTAITRAEKQAIVCGSTRNLNLVMARPTPQETMVVKRLRVSQESSLDALRGRSSMGCHANTNPE